MTETPHIRDNPAENRFETVIDGHVAKAEYVLEAGAIRFTHTEVPKELGGRGLGGALVRAGLKAARERGLKVRPDCPFFARFIKEHPDEHDILDPAYFDALEIERPRHAGD